MIQRIEIDHGGRNCESDEPSIGTLLKELTDETRTLLRQEVVLAKAEVSESVSTVGRNVAYLAVGGLVAYAGLLAVIAAACIGASVLLSQAIDSSIAAWLGPLIVGVIVAVVGYVLVHKAISTFKEKSLMPRKTMDSLRENTEWFKDRLKTAEHRMTQPESAIR